MTSDYSKNVIESLAIHADPARAIQMKKYMKDKFEFYGIPSPRLRKIASPFFQRNNPARSKMKSLSWFMNFGKPRKENCSILLLNY
jgi:3-methyladenine DNA glycosylase AlkD